MGLMEAWMGLQKLRWDLQRLGWGLSRLLRGPQEARMGIQETWMGHQETWMGPQEAWMGSPLDILRKNALSIPDIQRICKHVWREVTRLPPCSAVSSSASRLRAAVSNINVK